jgi:hypothetical protein
MLVPFLFGVPYVLMSDVSREATVLTSNRLVSRAFQYTTALFYALVMFLKTWEVNQKGINK